eukprot:TCONS_00032689-protein
MEIEKQKTYRPSLKNSKQFERILKQEGLFTRRNSDNILADVSSNQYQLHQMVNAHSLKGVNPVGDDHRLEINERLDFYNKSHNTAFHLAFTKDKDLDYEGALRFYYDDGKSELTKAVRINNRTTAEELIPTLVEKFSLPKEEDFSLYEVHEQDDEHKHNVLLYADQCPLARAISSKKVPRFVLRHKDENSNSTDLTESPTKKEKRKKLFSFSRNSEDKSEKEKKHKLPRTKKGKLDKSAISIEISHLEESTQSDADLDSSNLVDHQKNEDLAVNESEFESKSSPVVTLDSDPEEVLANEADLPVISSETLDGDEEEVEESIAPLPSASSSSTDLKRKLSFSNSSVFFDQDNDPPVLETRKEKKNKSKTDKKKKLKTSSRSKSFSMMVRGSKKKESQDPTALTELSTYKLAPGILKVFGDHVSKGSNYKAVRASTISTSQEVVKMALERYGLEMCNPKDYVLCDVVGHFSNPDATTSNKKKNSKKERNEDAEKEKEEPKWVTEYVRAINDNEKPLVLQSLWKPTNGRSRRFELRKRIEVESSCFFINTAEGMGRRSSSQTSLFDDSEHSSIGNNEMTEKAEYAPLQMSPHTNTRKITQRKENDESDNKAPQYSPYLLLLSGTNSMKDQLVHKLEDPTVVVGSYVENEMKQCNVVLYSNDVLLPHCWLYKKVKLEENSTETNLDEINFLVFVEPANGAEITVNGCVVTSTTLLKPGHLISFGKQYLFMFKDPTQSEDGFDRMSWWDHLSNPALNHAGTVEAVPLTGDYSTYARVTKTVGVQVETIKDGEGSDEHTDDEESEDDYQENNFNHQGEGQWNLATRREVNKHTLQFVYAIKDEEELLHTIIDIADKDLGEFKLIPAYFLVMAIEHSAASFTEVQTRKLLLKICNGLQGIAWEKTKEIGKQSSVKEEDPMTLLNKVLPELKPVLFWMSNALEMLHFLQNRLSSYLLPKDQVTTSKDALLTADEELLTVLEEVIMFTFQQTVYHLTKVLYIALPSIIDTNPFLDETDDTSSGSTAEKNHHPSVANIPKIFQKILEAAKEYQVHPQIVNQLFAYLFFFSNASLFNSLMERGPGGKFYRWTKGVQMRGNLDLLESWAQSNHLKNQYEEYLAKFQCAVDLLATPKAQLLQIQWSQMRAQNQALSPAQLQQILSEYQLPGQQRPRGWFPPPEKVEPALRTSEVLESFATHPPLMLPSANFKMTLDTSPPDEHFSVYFEDVRNKFSTVIPNGKVTTSMEPLKDDPSKTTVTVKSTKVRTQSKIDMDDVTKAFEQKDASRETTTTQVGSIKSIQVQSKKTAVRITTHSTKVNGHTTSTTSTSHENEVNTLLNEAQQMVAIGDETYEIPSAFTGNSDDVFVASLTRRDGSGLGLGLIDGMFTSLNSNGIFVRTIVPNTPASEDTRLRVGDRILAVNGNTLVGAGYNEAMDVIKKAGNRLSFLIAKSDDDVMSQILATST